VVLLSDVLFSEGFSAEALDSSRPIDVLFYGSSNPHREELRKEFQQIAAENNLRVLFRLDYDVFDLVRDSLVEQSKVLPVRGKYFET
jgi:hypothetical protein